jgi:hypothetical protein
MTRRIECITKLPTHQDRHRRIQAVGGPGWKDSEETAIANVKRDLKALAEFPRRAQFFIQGDLQINVCFASARQSKLFGARHKV